MSNISYLMEHDEEALRLDIKTGEAAVHRQASWAGISPGMRVADVGCGAGKTSAIFREMVQPGGSVVGIDGSVQRIEHANKMYGSEGLAFTVRDITEPLEDLGQFDFVWLRFVLEYFRNNAETVISNVARLVRPGGILCLIDLDHNCLNHHDMPPRLRSTIVDIMQLLEERANFDPYAGRKLYSHIYRLGYTDIAVEVSAHHLIYGPLGERDAYNWYKKVEVAADKLKYPFSEYAGGYGEFLDEFKRFLNDPGRFTYTPLICSRGRRPL